MSVVLSDIPEKEQMKLRFILKLWLVVNDTTKPYLRWNRERTVLIVNLETMMRIFFTGESTIFACRTIDNFLWLLYKHAFEKCTVDVLEESDRDETDLECSMVFRHPQFIGTNSHVFDAWLSLPAVRAHDHGQPGSCTLPSLLNFHVRENIPEFHEVRMRAMFAMMHLESMLRHPLREQNSTTTINVPEAHVDRPVMAVPPYFESNEIAEEPESTANEPMEEVTVIVDNETSSFLNDNGQETAVVAIETPITLQYNDLRELYESVNFWTTDTDGSVVEYHEIYEVENVAPQEVMVEGAMAGEEHVATSEEILLFQPTETGTPMEEGNMSAEYLTESVKACLPAIDFD
ncbi:uncharacterized protein LOC118510322 isoform X3 [Anopheles stephensi]|uniref:uncharacterized protein LOC118510322 isoform X3 n=1 Tax=Anopheles stephensi TaxID=30069 RepID=UPI00165890FE|nr:uncharacterized protein LOC118510322 isoform X3 [Anopheles stephensi]